MKFFEYGRFHRGFDVRHEQSLDDEQKSIQQYQLFRARLEQIGIDEFVKNTPGHDELSTFFGTWSSESTDHLQIGFGKRKRWLPDGTAVIERGPQLVYAIGPNGNITVQLHPCGSKASSMQEEHIFLMIGRPNAVQLENRLPRDLRRLVRLAYVSSIDGQPTVFDRVWYRWITWVSAHSTAGAFIRGGRRRWFDSTFGFLAGKLLDNVFTILLIIVLTGAGYSWVAKILGYG